MRPGGGGKKGGKFERDTCRGLTTWASGVKCPEETPVWFWRAASSGAKATQDAKRGRKTNMEGDIVAIDPRGSWFTEAYVIECKSYKNLEWNRFVFGQGFLWEVWYKNQTLALGKGKKSVLIVKQNQMPTQIVFPYSHELVKSLGVLEHTRLRFTDNEIMIFDVVITPFEKFIKQMDPKAFEHFMLVGE